MRAEKSGRKRKGTVALNYWEKNLDGGVETTRYELTLNDMNVVACFRIAMFGTLISSE